MSYNYACCGKPALPNALGEYEACESCEDPRAHDSDINWVPVNHCVKDAAGIIHEIRNINQENEHDRHGSREAEDAGEPH